MLKGDVGTTRGVFYRQEGSGAFREADFDNQKTLCRAFWDLVSAYADIGVHTQGRTTMTLFAHNISYDMLATGAYDHLPKNGQPNTWKLEHPYSKGPIYIMRGHRGRRNLTVLSSTNFFGGTLKALGEGFGLAKLSPDADNDWNTKDVAALETYCRRDVEIMRVAILWLITKLADEDGEGHPLGPWRMTLPSVSFAAWRFRFMSHEIELHTDPRAIALERAAFCGGRTEAFYLGEYDSTMMHDMDVNNLYGFVMKETQLPCRLVDFMECSGVQGALSVLNLENKMDSGHAVIAEVEIAVEAPVAPEKGERLMFPVGSFVTTLCTPELRLVQKHGTITRVNKIAIYETAPIFHDAVKYFSEKRREAQEAAMKRSAAAGGDEDMQKKAKSTDPLGRLYKDLNNLLYGKFGQMQEEWERIADAPAVLPPHGQERQELWGPDNKREAVIKILPTGVYRWDGNRTEAFYAFPAISAYVTSYARAHLWKMMSIANAGKTPFEGRHAFYGDTDSVFVDKVGHERLVAAGVVDELVLGMLKEEWSAVSVSIAGAKWYSYTSFKDGKLHQKHKGVPMRAVLASDIATHETTYRYDMFPGLDGMLAAGHGAGQFVNRRMRKKMTVEYTKGQVQADGWVRPLRRRTMRADAVTVEVGPVAVLDPFAAPPPGAPLEE